MGRLSMRPYRRGKVLFYNQQLLRSPRHVVLDKCIYAGHSSEERDVELTTVRLVYGPGRCHPLLHALLHALLHPSAT